MVTTWKGTSYNSTTLNISPKMVTVTDTCANAGNTSLGQQKCFSPVKLLPVALALAEINEPTSLSYTITVGKDSLYYSFGIAGHEFYLNNRSVPYPVVFVKQSWGPYIVNSNVPPPTTDHGPYVYASANCSTPSQTKHSTILGDALTAAKYPRPLVGYQAHHIKEICWNGSDSEINGIWLPTTAAGEPNLHQNFTTWWIPNSKFTP